MWGTNPRVTPSLTVTPRKVGTAKRCPALTQEFMLRGHPRASPRGGRVQSAASRGCSALGGREFHCCEGARGQHGTSHGSHTLEEGEEGASRLFNCFNEEGSTSIDGKPQQRTLARHALPFHDDIISVSHALVLLMDFIIQDLTVKWVNFNLNWSVKTRGLKSCLQSLG